MEDKISFAARSPHGQGLRQWWESLEDDREARAQLRRASDITAITLTPGFQRLVRRLTSIGLPAQLNVMQQERLAAIAGVLAHIRHADERRLPETMRGTDKAKVSELRFRRLLESPSIDDLYVGLRRILPLVDHSADPNLLANDIWFWGDKVRKEWAYAYPWDEKAG